MTGVAPVSVGLRAVTGRGRPGRSFGPPDTATGGSVRASPVGLAGLCRAASNRSGAWIVHMSMRNFMPKKPTDKNAIKAADKDIRWMASTMRAVVLLSQPCSYNELPSRSATSKFVMQLTSTQNLDLCEHKVYSRRRTHLLLGMLSK